MENFPINPADLVVFAVIVLSGLLAFARGLIRELLSAAGWIGAAAVAWFGFDRVLPITRQFISVDFIATGVTAAALFVAALIVLSLVGHMVASQVRDSALNAVDRSLGFIFGVARGALLVCLAYLVLAWIHPPEEQPPVLRAAKTMPLIERGAAMLRTLVPAEMRGPGPEDEAPGTTGAADAPAEQRARDLAAPRPTAPKSAAPEGESGYNTDARRDMERLIQSTE
jgi:membrane protein required for colicin V production